MHTPQSPDDNHSDRAPLPESIKPQLRDRLIAKFGPRVLGDDHFNLLWDMISSATWEYRQASLSHPMDVQSILEDTQRLARQLSVTLGLTSADYEYLAKAMISLYCCAGYFGIYLDRDMILSV